MRLGFSLLSMLTAALLAGCGQVMVFGHVVGEKPPAEEAQPANPSARSASTLQVKAFQITVAPQATENVASDATFSSDALLAALRNELRSRNLLAEQRSPPDGTLQIQVSEVVLRPSSNAIVFGYKTMSSTLIADLQLSGADGKAAAPFHIAAQARLTISTRTAADDPLGPLYRRFAVLTADRLMGIESKPDPATSGDIQRF